MSSGITDARLPWVPPLEEAAAGALGPALATMLAATLLIFAVESMRDRRKRALLHRYSLARHRVLRAGFYRFLGEGAP